MHPKRRYGATHAQQISKRSSTVDKKAAYLNEEMHTLEKVFQDVEKKQQHRYLAQIQVVDFNCYCYKQLGYQRKHLNKIALKILANKTPSLIITCIFVFERRNFETHFGLGRHRIDAPGKHWLGRRRYIKGNSKKLEIFQTMILWGD